MKEYRNEDGKYHRVNGPTFVWDNGDYDWWYNGQRHRYYGTAWRWNGEDEYFIFGDKII